MVFTMLILWAILAKAVINVTGFYYGLLSALWVACPHLRTDDGIRNWYLDLLVWFSLFVTVGMYFIGQLVYNLAR